jgi:hypothetical protein
MILPVDVDKNTDEALNAQKKNIAIWDEAFNASKNSSDKAIKRLTLIKTPYLLTLALTKFLLEFITQPIRSGSRSEKSNYPKSRIFISHSRLIFPT